MGAQPTVIDLSSASLAAAIAESEETQCSLDLFRAGRATGAKASAGPVAVDQAVFTSIRSTTAGGYRITAASSGLTQPERQEITQRCPSHASLTDERENAEALFAWPLRSGRYAVGWSRHAGVEHTGRGGFRVHTHVAVLDAAAYRRFECHPIRVYSAMLEALPPEPFLEALPALEPLLLPDPAATYHVWVSAIGIGCNRDAIFALLDCALAGKSAAAAGVTAPFAVVEAVVAMLPRGQRPAISVSIGLKPSPSRPARLLLMSGGAEEGRRLTFGQNVAWLDLSGPEKGVRPLLPERPDGRGQPVREPEQAQKGSDPFSETSWLGLARRWWADGRRANFCRLAERVDFDASPAELGRIASICHDVDAVFSGDPIALEKLAARYTEFKPANGLEMELISAAREAITSWQAG